MVERKLRAWGRAVRQVWRCVSRSGKCFVEVSVALIMGDDDFGCRFVLHPVLRCQCLQKRLGCLASFCQFRFYVPCLLFLISCRFNIRGFLLSRFSQRVFAGSTGAAHCGAIGSCWILARSISVACPWGPPPGRGSDVGWVRD